MEEVVEERHVAIDCSSGPADERPVLGVVFGYGGPRSEVSLARALLERLLVKLVDIRCVVQVGDHDNPVVDP